MPISRVYLENFRLFKKKDLNLSENKVFIQGKNGSGKTSILESIELLMNGRSFRTSKSKDCINHESNYFQVSLKGSYRQQDISYNGINKFNGRISFSRKLNEKTTKKPSRRKRGFQIREAELSSLENNDESNEVKEIKNNKSENKDLLI